MLLSLFYFCCTGATFLLCYSPLDTNLVNKVGYEYKLLASSTSTSSSNTVTIESLSNYKYILFSRTNSSGQWTNACMIPVELFKTLFSSRTKSLTSGYSNCYDQTDHFVYTWYVNDTTIGLCVSTSGDVAVLYGIK